MTEDPKPHLVNRSWLEEPKVRALMEVLNSDGEETRIVGGAVRNALLGEEIADIDLTSTAPPERVITLCEDAGYKTIPTGVDHGTVTVVVEERSFEVTTLRADVSTDGRHAVVAFGRDFTEDAKRRDFTMNALSIDVEGKVHDPLGGYKDLIERQVRFIGDPERRIREDYLRALRFFRFFAWFGDGRPDRDALKAVVRTKAGLETLSAERIWTELLKILGAPDPERATLWMRTTEVLETVLPENWGLDQFHWLIHAERTFRMKVDPIRRLQAMLRPDEAIIRALARRLKLSNKDTERLISWSFEMVDVERYASESVAGLAKHLYRGKPDAIADALIHEAAKRLHKQDDSAERVQALASFAETFERPVFPVSGSDLKERGFKEGRILGNKLLDLQEEWIESGFKKSREELLDGL
ncbi:MAG: CCA tRNA nucleotidyltransferase [Pseudomonadota bacterium]